MTAATTATLKAKKPKERILIFEETEAIQRARDAAEQDLKAVNSIHEVLPFSTLEDLAKFAQQAEQIVQKLFFERFPEAARAAQYSTIDFKLPPDLQRIKTSLQSVRGRKFEFCIYNDESKAWHLDEQKLFEACDRYREYASTPEEIARWKFCVEFCRFMNEEVRPGRYAKQKIVGLMAKVDPHNHDRIIPRWQFVKENLNW